MYTNLEYSPCYYNGAMCAIPLRVAVASVDPALGVLALTMYCPASSWRTLVKIIPV